MKNILAIVLMLTVTFAYSQEASTPPKYEKQGDFIIATYFHDNGAIAQKGQFNENNKLEGTWVSYDKTGNKQALSQYRNGIKVGTWLFWQDNNLREVDYNNNVIENVGEWTNKTQVAISN
ncbi:toxin-antitoxin system YwqK family antitoxin [Bizionia paragorgiae]|uniref:MORN repeat variant n=1 Tax=Bizionia paragorgiae TaxID=283786 RepID=A0A1H4AY34_BIZPA|nr:nicotinic acid mononucleotide adenyltransferase [Bizionia paragorgiae]SEA40542.1 hypothetical protein SAMN04487990_11258 [Bizionia paragorgiae]